jgi:hypothetical protein
MPDPSLTHITLVLDRSGSMQSVRDDAVGGFNAFLEQQRKLPGRATLTLIQFDDIFEEVFRGKPVAEVPLLDGDTFIPRGSTALYDAVGKSAAETLEYVRGLDEEKRPAQVIVAVLTDGQENASKEYTYKTVRSVLDEFNGKPGWEILFLAADMAVVKDARRLGVAGKGSLHYDPSKGGTRAAFDVISSRVTMVRSVASPPDDDEDPGSKGR